MMAQPNQEKEPLLATQVSAKEYQTTPLRWLILLSVAGVFITQGLVMTAFAPVAIQISQAYGLSSTVTVNMCVMSFSLCSPPSDFLAVYLFRKYRTDTVLRVASIISFTGAMLRFLALSTGEFWPILMGTFLMACVASIFLNCQMIIANKWFSDRERAIAMAVLNVSTPIGQITSFALSAFAYSEVTDSLPKDELNSVVISSTERLLVCQNVAYIVFFLLFQIFIRDKPEKPPSAVATAPPSNEPLVVSFKQMWRNKDFMVLALSYALIYGIYCALGSTMSNILNPFGYTPTDISIAGGTCLLSGVVGALAIGFFLDCTALYRKTHISLSFMTLMANVMLALAIQLGNGHSLGSLLPGILLFGIAAVSFFPTSLSYGAELTFPLQPALCNACMNFLGQIFAFIFMGLSVMITDIDTVEDDLTSETSIEERQKSSLTVVYLLGLGCLTTLILSCRITERLGRLNYKEEEDEDGTRDQNEQTQNDLSSSVPASINQ